MKIISKLPKMGSLENQKPANRIFFELRRTIEQTILYKMRRLRAFYDIFFPRYINRTVGSKMVFFWAFHEIVVSRPKNVVESSETSHFVENCLLYRSM